MSNLRPHRTALQQGKDLSPTPMLALVEAIDALSRQFEPSTLHGVFDDYFDRGAEVNVVTVTGYGSINGTVDSLDDDHVTIRTSSHGIMHVALRHIVNVWEVHP